jgi:hypothetical protein
MRFSKILIITSLAYNGLFAQSIVKDTANVKKPKEGKLYYQKTDNNLYLFRNGFELVDLYQENIIVPPDTSIVNPPIGDGNALKSYIPKFVWVWGFFSGINSKSGNLENNRVHYAEQSAMSDKRFREQRPWYSFDTNPTTVKVGYEYSTTENKWLFDERYSDTDWQMTQDICDKNIEYVIKTGLQYFNFLYYANGNDGSVFRSFYEKSQKKRGLKAAYTVGQFGGGEFSDTNSDYRKNIEHFVWAMNQDWYQTIDGKPIVFHYNSVSENNKNAAYIRQLYGKPIYEVYVESGFGSDYLPVVQSGFKARSWYYNYNDQKNSTHSFQSIIDDVKKGVDGIITDGREVVPTFTISYDGRARETYPYDSPQYGRYGYNGHPESYYNLPTESEIKQLYEYGTYLEKKYPKQVKTYGYANFDENSEAGKLTLMPKKRNDGSIDDTMVRWLGTYYYSIAR